MGSRVRAGIECEEVSGRHYRWLPRIGFGWEILGLRGWEMLGFVSVRGWVMLGGVRLRGWVMLVEICVPGWVMLGVVSMRGWVVLGGVRVRVRVCLLLSEIHWRELPDRDRWWVILGDWRVGWLRGRGHTE